MLPLPVLQLRRRRQLSVQQQIRRFQVRRFLRQFFDRISPVPQNPHVAINIRDPADARSRVVVRRIVTDHPEIGGIHLDLPQVHGPNSVVRDGNFVALPGAVIRDCQRLARAGGCPRQFSFALLVVQSPCKLPRESGWRGAVRLEYHFTPKRGSGEIAPRTAPPVRHSLARPLTA